MRAMQKIAAAAAAATGLFTGSLHAEPAVFPSAEAAVDAMIAALETHDREGMLRIFGPENEDVISTGDSTEDRQEWGAFLAHYKLLNRLEVEDEDRATLFTGRDFAAFPIGIIETEQGWTFDAEGAREEILMRRIGANELAVITIMARAGAIQNAYRRTDHDGDGVKEFAASILSTPGGRDGLYWQAATGTELSPLDASVARSNLTGYSADGQDFAPEPHEGYYFRILQGQGPSAAGGAYSYMVNGNMVAGFALLAVPAAYGDTGIMSFMTSEAGAIYEADLGEDSLEAALAIDVFDPGEGWEAMDPAEWINLGVIAAD